MKLFPSSTSGKAASGRGISGSYSARTSRRGIVCTRVNSSRRRPSIHQIRQSEHDACRDRVLDVVEAVVEAAITLAEPVSGAGEGKAPHGRAGERQQRVRQKRHLEDPGRDRDEGTDDGHDSPEKHAEIPPAVEPRFGAVESFGRDVEPAAVALEQRPAAVAADRPANERADEVAQSPGEGERDVRAGAEADPGAE